MGRRLRRVSIYATRLSIALGIGANTLTGIMIVVGLGAAAAFAAPAWWPIVGVVGIELYLLLDCSDGEVARWNQSQSAVGVYLDRFGHYVVEAAIPVALGVRAADSGINGWLIIGMAASIALLVSKAETDLVDMARLNAGMSAMPDQARTMRPKGLAAGRRLVSYLPFHRIVHAVEASLQIGVAVVLDNVSDTLKWTQGLLIALLVSASVTAVLHLVSVLTSTRLTAE